jgi:hypothetical protein
MINDLAISEVEAPIFDTEVTPLPDQRDLTTARWPKTRDILARGVLAASLRAGGHDIADDEPARAESIGKREYHHLFPDSLLTQVGGLPEGQSYRALNCALITWSTNRNITNKAPMQYLEERVSGSNLGAEAVASRLRSHLIPYAELAQAGPYEKEDGERLRADYERFLDARARLMLPFMHDLCQGRAPR